MGTMIVLTSANFETEVLKNWCPVLVLWTEPMSVAGGKLAMEISKLQSAKVNVGKVDISAQPGLAMSNSIVSAPWLVLYVGGMPVAQGSSVTPEILNAIG